MRSEGGLTDGEVPVSILILVRSSPVSGTRVHVIQQHFIVVHLLFRMKRNTPDIPALKTAIALKTNVLLKLDIFVI